MDTVQLMMENFCERRGDRPMMKVNLGGKECPCRNYWKWFNLKVGSFPLNSESSYI